MQSESAGRAAQLAAHLLRRSCALGMWKRSGAAAARLLLGAWDIGSRCGCRSDLMPGRRPDPVHTVFFLVHRQEELLFLLFFSLSSAAKKSKFWSERGRGIPEWGPPGEGLNPFYKHRRARLAYPLPLALFNASVCVCLASGALLCRQRKLQAVVLPPVCKAQSASQRMQKTRILCDRVYRYPELISDKRACILKFFREGGCAKKMIGFMGQTQSRKNLFCLIWKKPVENFSIRLRGRLHKIQYSASD